MFWRNRTTLIISLLMLALGILWYALKPEASEQPVPLSSTEVAERLASAEAAFKVGDYATATTLYEEIIARNGGNARLYHELAHYYRYWYKFPESEAAFLRALEYEPENHRILTDLGKLYRNMGEYEKAEAVLAESIALEPNDPETYSFGLGYLYLEQERFAEAEAAFVRSLELDPTYDLALTGLGDVASRQGAYHEAIERYQSALAIDPLSEALYSLGMAQRELGEYDRALETFDRYLKNKNERAEVYFQMGVTYERMNERSSAHAAFKKAYELNPDRELFREALTRYEPSTP